MVSWKAISKTISWWEQWLPGETWTSEITQVLETPLTPFIFFPSYHACVVSFTFHFLFHTALRDSTQGQQMSVWNINITDKGQCFTKWYENMPECVLSLKNVKSEEARRREWCVLLLIVWKERSAEHETKGVKHLKAGQTILGWQCTYLTFSIFLEG